MNTFTKNWLFPEVFIISIFLSACSQNIEQPKTLLADPVRLQETKKRALSREGPLSKDVTGLRAIADEALKLEPLSVTQKPYPPPSGDLHDYMSLAPYWWPNPDTEDGLPYIRKDGVVNPERNAFDRIPLENLTSSIEALALAYFFTDHEPYAEHAATLMNVWFFDETTRMNPNMKYGQAIRGITDGRGIGLIEARAFYRIAEAVQLLRGSTHWSVQSESRYRDWCEAFFDWMHYGEFGKEEAAEQNNHGTWYDVTSAYLALYIGRPEEAASILEGTKARIDLQIDGDGSMPLELKRTRSFHYSAMTLIGFFTAAQLADELGIDLWGFKGQDGGGLIDALEYLIPHSIHGEPWEHQQIRGWEPNDSRRMEFLLRVAFEATGNSEYIEMLDSIPESATPRYDVRLLFGNR